MTIRALPMTRTIFHFWKVPWGSLCHLFFFEDSNGMPLTSLLCLQGTLITALWPCLCLLSSYSPHYFLQYLLNLYSNIFPQAAYEFVSISNIYLYFFFFPEFKEISFSSLFLSHFVCFILIFEIPDILKCLCEGINSPWRAVLFCSISASFLWVDSSVECFDLDFLLILTFALWRWRLFLSFALRSVGGCYEFMG